MLLVWWVAVHVVPGAALLASAAPKPIVAALLTGLLLNAALRAPRPPVTLVRHADATWTVPQRGLAGLRPARGSCCTTFCVRLVLAGPHGRCRVLLVRDQLDERAWRSLQASLRRTLGGPPD